MKFDVIEQTTTMSSAYSVADSTVFDLGAAGCDAFSVTSAVTVSTPTNKTFASTAVNTGTEVITLASHGYSTGLVVQISNPGTLPTGITGSTNYYIIALTANTFQLASSLENALAGTPIDITAQGSGTNTVNVTALAGANIKLQQTNNTTAGWLDLGSATNITTSGTIGLEKDRPTMRYVRIYLTLTAGALSVTNYALGKGDK